MTARFPVHDWTDPVLLDRLLVAAGVVRWEATSFTADATAGIDIIFIGSAQDIVTFLSWAAGVCRCHPAVTAGCQSAIVHMPGPPLSYLKMYFLLPCHLLPLTHLSHLHMQSRSTMTASSWVRTEHVQTCLVTHCVPPGSWEMCRMVLPSAPFCRLRQCIGQCIGRNLTNYVCLRRHQVHLRDVAGPYHSSVLQEVRVLTARLHCKLEMHSALPACQSEARLQ